ncbi:ABC transporter permease [Ferrovibrio sp.]|uniref:ABC transporter permease n=1 Tax=Ferrovibrio sp. TaxID=1917215 RepID=UPI0025BBF29B|nr:ABC transporter permease [Ferrovibrio sp.]MBX3452947.1 ABC transporter permease [Ferrovibrio sp.]
MIGQTHWLHRFRRRGPAVLAAVILALLAIIAIFGPAVYGTDPWSMVAAPFLEPLEESEYLLGTDALGRDVAAGLIYGARLSLLIGLAASCAAMMIGVLLGAVAGYYRGAADDFLMRCTETFQTIPSFIFLLVLVAIAGPSTVTIVIAIALVSWPPIARLTRAEFLSLREREYVQACILSGMGDMRIIFLQILPNAITPVVVMASILVANAILSEAALSFLGLGDPNQITWGTMIGVGRESLRTAPYLCVLPGIAIFITVLAINLLGDGINDVLNPRSSS